MILLDPADEAEDEEAALAAAREEAALAERAQAEAQARAQALAEAREKAAAEARAEAEAQAEARRKALAEAKARAEAEARKRAELKAKAEARAKAEAQARAREEAEAREAEEARRAAEAKAREKARAKALKAAQEKAKAEAEAKARAEEEARRKTEEAARKKAEAEARAKAEAEARRKAEEAAKAKAASEAKKKAEEAARAKAEAEAEAKAEAQAKAEAEAEAEVKRKAEEAAEAKAAAEAKLKAEAEAKAKAEKAARALAKAEAKAVKEAEQKARAEAAAQAEAEAEAKRKAEAQAALAADESAATKASETAHAPSKDTPPAAKRKAGPKAKPPRPESPASPPHEPAHRPAHEPAHEPIHEASPGAPADLGESFRRLIRTAGPISLAQFMAESNARYYNSRDPLGGDGAGGETGSGANVGDFITAPEVSQMFGELIGLWLADLWVRMGGSDRVQYVELGPGKGTLATDALRAAGRYGFDPPVHFVEGSQALRKVQLEAFPRAIHHHDLTTLPDDRPLLIVANEFFDALPIHQLVCAAQGWHEKLVGLEQDQFVFVAGSEPMDALVPETWRSAPQGTLIETSPAACALMAEIAARLARQGGAALIIDYGPFELRSGSTLQAIRRHRHVDPFTHPGEADLTAHVDFELLQSVAIAHGAEVMGIEMQGDWLRNLGIDIRLEALQRREPGKADVAKRQYDRLVADDQMGTLFKVLGICGRRWPIGVGFAPR